MNADIQKLLDSRYFLKEETEWKHLAKRVGGIYIPMRDHIRDMEFIPSTPTLQNCNTKGERKGTLSSCFILEIEDSIEGIFEALKEGAIVTKFGGGIGYDFTKLRGAEELIKSISRKSSGSVSFIAIFNAMLEGIRQGGARKGAGMGQLSIYHPDILDFIAGKENLKEFERLNFSIRIPDSFYKRLKIDPNAVHHVEDVASRNIYPLKDKQGNCITTKQLWDKIIHMAWKVAEPGIFNSDIAHERCTVTNLSDDVSSNPCVEFTGIPYQSCNLGSINLAKGFVLSIDGNFNWNKFGDLTVKGVRYLNKVIDHNVFPLKKIKDVTLATRPIGLGTMGLAHLFIQIGIPYNSKEAVKLTEEIYRYMTLRGMQESILLAKENGKSYDAFDYDTFLKANKRFFTKKKCREIDIEQLLKDLKKYGIYNSSITSIAPTGSISVIAQSSSGGEPIFALTYQRKVELLNKEYDIMYVTDPEFNEYVNWICDFDKEKVNKILEKVANNEGSCQGIGEIPDKMQNIFVTAMDMSPDEHLDILEAIANNVSLSVSKTVNLRKDIDEQTVSDIYIEAHRRGIIGVTVYKQGSRDGILINNNTEERNITNGDAPKRPEVLPADVHRVKFDKQNWIVFVGLRENRAFEIFAGMVKDVDIEPDIKIGQIRRIKKGHYTFESNGKVLVDNIGKAFDNQNQDAFGRIISLNLRHIKLDYLVQQLEKSKGDIASFSKVLGRVIKKYADGLHAGICPECQSKLIFTNGCIECLGKCGWGGSCG